MEEMITRASQEIQQCRQQSNTGESQVQEQQGGTIVMEEVQQMEQEGQVNQSP